MDAQLGRSWTDGQLIGPASALVEIRDFQNSPSHELRTRAQFTAAGLRESHAHDVVITKEAPTTGSSRATDPLAVNPDFSPAQAERETLTTVLVAPEIRLALNPRLQLYSFYAALDSDGFVGDFPRERQIILKVSLLRQL
ncbi:MAG TPA: hypothetical protein VMS98_09740 [Thermoanaerobaculia bacterium]|nr:hypothetical protein [Thermoanaerobaculia bacterium]